MTNHQATLSRIRMATSHSDTGPYTASKSFYDGVRAKFLQESARYLRAGITAGDTVTLPAEPNAVPHKVQGQYRPCY